MAELPANLWNEPPGAFADQYNAMVERGCSVAKRSAVAFVGLARNCGPALIGNLHRVEQAVAGFESWSLHVETNDSSDNTVAVLDEFCRRHEQASYRNQTLDRPHCPGEFAGRRTIALAEYRTACQQWVANNTVRNDYVVVVDWDLWGGWEPNGLLNSIAWLDVLDAQGKRPGGMASVSLFQYDFGSGPQWCHYDLWALRGVGQPTTYWDTYTNGHGAFGFWYLPPIGSEPVAVASAFGGMAVYSRRAYLWSQYLGATDCEHVAFHRTMSSGGYRMFLNPSQRTLVNWMELANAGHGVDGVPNVSDNA